jgi:hypothetical protein
VQEKIEAARKGLETDTDVFGLLRAYFHTTKRCMTPIEGTLVDLNRSDKRNALAPEEVAAQTIVITSAGQDTTVMESNEQRSGRGANAFLLLGKCARPGPSGAFQSSRIPGKTPR